LIELDSSNAVQYLWARGYAPGGGWRVQTLGGGVSNTVLLATSGDFRWVLKQSLGRLRVSEEWLADRTRIRRECMALNVLRPLLPAGAVPAVVFEDPENLIFAMEAAPAGAKDWKTLLMAGEVDLELARQAGKLLVQQIAAAAPHALFSDQTCFRQLRLDPYYLFLIPRYPELRDQIMEAVESCRQRCLALVHGDFSPKNMLIFHGCITLIDFEVIHYGDPGFDAAFLLNHLLLKAIHRPSQRDQFRSAAEIFWREITKYCPAEVSSAMRHIGCLHLARVDGKSPAEYLTQEERATVRNHAVRLILTPPQSIEEIFAF
jgi:5-methylthioribose kinase